MTPSTIPSDISEQAPSSFANAPLDQAWLLSNLGYLCTRVAAQARGRFSTCWNELSPVEFSIAAVLASNAEVNQKQLCLALDMSAPSLTLTLDRLVARRLVRRVRSTRDRRETFVHLTSAGSTLYEQGLRAAMATNQEAEAVLTDIERLLLVNLLRKVAGL
ncbi:MAG: MarR family transcriptional regulator [Polaromonas sp.]|nr:MarR family transcriptional regulator [Polaromonas sp.]